MGQSDIRHASPMFPPPPISAPALSPEQLQQFPVWRYLLDGEGGKGTDESFVTPAEPPTTASYGSYVVAAIYRFSDGNELPGAVQLDQLGKRRLFSPILIQTAGKNLDPLAADVAERLTRLRKAPVGAPIRWTLAITLPGDDAPISRRIFTSRTLLVLGLFVRLVSLFFTPRGR